VAPKSQIGEQFLVNLCNNSVLRRLKFHTVFLTNCMVIFNNLLLKMPKHTQHAKHRIPISVLNHMLSFGPLGRLLIKSID